MSGEKNHNLSEMSLNERLHAVTMDTSVGAVLKEVVGCVFGHDWDIEYHEEKPGLDSAYCEHCGRHRLRGNRYVSFPTSMAERPEEYQNQ